MRIDRAVKVLNNDVHREQNIDSLTFQSGFTSREAFFTVFKSIMGKTPTEFLLETTNDKSR
jgi:methylphosphotriester-DNA--protein-cysteine methyltransferase